MSIRGSCLCGSIEYQLDGPLGAADNCHCSLCRRSHGAAFATYVSIDPASFHWVKGEDDAGRYQSSLHASRIFCRNCGSPLVAEVGGRYLAVTLASLDTDVEVRPRFHMFVGSKAPWYEITDGLPQYAEYPPSIAPLAQAKVG